jgi:hypothetical protein
MQSNNDSDSHDFWPEMSLMAVLVVILLYAIW